MKRNVFIIGAVVALVIIAAGGFYGGMVYGESQVVVPDMALGPQGAGAPGELVLPGSGQARGMGGNAQGGMIVGEIVSIDETGLVIANLEGKEIQVSVTDTTLIEKQASVTLAELTTGETVSVSGSEEDDESITARSLQVVSAARFDGLATQ